LKITPSCRLEQIPLENIKIFAPDLDFYPVATYMDVAHNPPAISNLIRTVKSIHERDDK
jgi:folylpolyglutamate synthase/dihydropteroate synthase